MQVQQSGDVFMQGIGTAAVLVWNCYMINLCYLIVKQVRNVTPYMLLNIVQQACDNFFVAKSLLIFLTYYCPGLYYYGKFILNKCPVNISAIS